ncbi:hypothetical protein NMY22_g15156 [Coprinellus aureogranulatus]|nr:hypothetical protein NMY22_g15156 [Coprinellus aureogranulatus]
MNPFISLHDSVYARPWERDFSAVSIRTHYRPQLGHPGFLFALISYTDLLVLHPKKTSRLLHENLALVKRSVSSPSDLWNVKHAQFSGGWRPKNYRRNAKAFAIQIPPALSDRSLLVARDVKYTSGTWGASGSICSRSPVSGSIRWVRIHALDLDRHRSAPFHRLRLSKPTNTSTPYYDRQTSMGICFLCLLMLLSVARGAPLTLEWCAARAHPEDIAESMWMAVNIALRREPLEIKRLSAISQLTFPKKDAHLDLRTRSPSKADSESS